MTVTLSPELERFIERQISSGRYGSSEEVIREALRLLEERNSRESAQNEVRRKIAVGLEQARRGELLDGEEVFAELEREFDGGETPGTR